MSNLAWDCRGENHLGLNLVVSCFPAKRVVPSVGKSDCAATLVIPCRWYKYGRRQRRIFFGYTAFAGLGLLFLAMIIGFIMYGLHSGISESAGSLGGSAKGFMVSTPNRQELE